MLEAFVSSGSKTTSVTQFASSKGLWSCPLFETRLWGSFEVFNSRIDNPWRTIANELPGIGLDLRCSTSTPPAPSQHYNRSTTRTPNAEHIPKKNHTTMELRQFFLKPHTDKKKPLYKSQNRRNMPHPLGWSRRENQRRAPAGRRGSSDVRNRVLKL